MPHPCHANATHLPQACHTHVGLGRGKFPAILPWQKIRFGRGRGRGRPSTTPKSDFLPWQNFTASTLQSQHCHDLATTLPWPCHNPANPATTLPSYFLTMCTPWGTYRSGECNRLSFVPKSMVERPPKVKRIMVLNNCCSDLCLGQPQRPH